MQTFLEIVLPAFLVFTTLFGLLSRGNPRPFVSHLYYGLLIGGTLLTLFAAAGTALKKKER
jgi:glycerol uptake facilitator-like aquaporin